ncbi:MAG: 1-phosphofructokinase [Streptococcaceae bacterium]|jgi:1-phosphofructokinase|nr:1-phosphofructokinase [Streptococcaceae bacterium]
MIYTVTLNPALDYFMGFDKVVQGEINRANSAYMRPGGKGIIESRMLTRLGTPNVALGFLGGFSGKFIQDFLHHEGVASDFTEISEVTRVNMTAKTATDETSFNAAGPNLTLKEVQQFLVKFDSLTKDDIVVLAGKSLPELGADFYQQLIATIKAKGAQFAIDVEGQDVLEALPQHPIVIKPNREELGEIFSVKFDSVESILPYGRKMLDLGAQNVMISMAGDGALLIADDGNAGSKAYFAEPVKGILKNSVGAGDSTVAGFLAEWQTSHNPVKAFKQGVACGTAKVFSEDLPSREFINKCFEKITIKEIS